jgi:predicted nucleic acid-binding Zn ribbon protein
MEGKKPAARLSSWPSRRSDSPVRGPLASRRAPRQNVHVLACTVCGAPLPADARFCQACGAPVESDGRLESAKSRQVVDNITLYWLTGTASAARAYWELGRAQALAADQPPPDVSLPVGFTTFPGEIFQAPRSWVEQSYPNLIYFNEVDSQTRKPNAQAAVP